MIEEQVVTTKKSGIKADRDCELKNVTVLGDYSCQL
jgi:hypothetical protein